MAETPEGITSRRTPALAIGICAGVLLILLLHQTRSIFAPLAFALLAIAVVWPIQRALQRKLPKLVALALSAAITFPLVTGFVSIVAWAFSRVTRYVIDDASRFQSLYGLAASWLEQHGIVVASLWAEYFNVGWLLRLFQQLLSTINGTLSFSLIVVIYVILGLLEVDVVAQRLRGMTNAAFGQNLLAASTETATKLRRYMTVRTMMSLATGALVWAFAYITGLEFAVEWGVIAFALNYIPFIGPFIATILPTLFAVAQFQSLQMVVLVFACLNVIQFMVGSYLEPRIAGKALAMSPFLVLFAVFFWAGLWGLAGAFIGVPIVIALLTFCAQFPSSRWVVELFGEAPDDADRLTGG
jgi:predicted PurR-regulated permease PerM